MRQSAIRFPTVGNGTWHGLFKVSAARLCCLIALAVGAATSQAAKALWFAEPTRAWTHALTASDGTQAILEVRCGEPPREVRLHHPALDRLERISDPSPDYDRTVRMTIGWNLDPDNPRHIGATWYLRPCPDTVGCGTTDKGSAARWSTTGTDWNIKRIATGWSAFIRMQPAGEPGIELRFSFAGSSQAIQTACARQPSPRRE